MTINIEDIEVGDKVQLINGDVHEVLDSIYLPFSTNVQLKGLYGNFAAWEADIVAIIPKGKELSPHYKELIAYAHGADIEHEYEDGEWVVEYLPRFLRDERYRVALKVTKSPNQIEKEAIQAEMEALSKRLEVLDVE